MTLEVQVAEFLSQKRIAVAGVSSKTPGAANAIYRKLREAGYEVFAINPNAESVEGDMCFPNLSAVSGGVDAVVMATPPDGTNQLVRECAELGIFRVWIHRNNLFGQGSYSEAAVAFCTENDIDVIAGACPLMYCEPVDLGHKCMRWILGTFGKLPQVE